MGIVLARIDSRLIHGQVLEAWVPHVQANCIMVANDRIGALSLQKKIMKAAVPRGIEVFIGSLVEVAQQLAGARYSGLKVLLLFDSSRDALRGHRDGIPLTELNLGNMHAGEGKQRYSCTLALDAEDIANFDALEACGVKIVSQCLPADHERDWHKLMALGGG
ncbi:MAG: PTS N-acetylgalactosamine transporter subunit IIB [Desulfuromonas sp.]|nr:MAG: PTS N-acetylgalactosamine transporter subunit IIB [Desulfuromonas sp.]